MEVYEAIHTVLAVREFNRQPVDDNVILRIVESARLTGSSMNQQPWHFVVVQNRETLSEIGKLVSSGSYSAQAAFAVVVAVNRSSEYGISDASRAIQSMILTAWSEGIGSNWTGWVGMETVASLLGMPTELDVIAVLPFGYPARVLNKGVKRRKKLTEVAHSERFGQPLSLVLP